LEATHIVDYDTDAYARGIRILLSGIARMHGRFGKAMIAQMLGGSNNKKIQQWKLNRLSTYGMLGGLTQPQLTDLMDAVIAVGLASQTEVEDRRPTVSLTPDGEAVMRARQPIPTALKVPYPLAKRLALICEAIEGGDVSAEASASNSSASPPTPRTEPTTNGKIKESDDNVSPDTSAALAELDTELMDRLKRWRSKTSAALGIPAYRVISNATIERVAAQLPKSIAELEAIQGIGSATIEQFGYDLMRLIQGNQQASEKRVEAPPQPARTKTDTVSAPKIAVAKIAAPAIIAPDASRSQQAAPAKSPADTEQPANDPDPGDAYWTWRLFRDGYSWQQVAQIRGRSSTDVARDLIVAAKTGHLVQASWGIGVSEAKEVLPWSVPPGVDSKQLVPKIVSSRQA